MVAAEELIRQGQALGDRFGADRADAFGRVLPGLVAGLTARWGLGIESLFPAGATSVVLAVSTADRRPAVLKVSPDAAFLARQAGMLRHILPSGRVPVVLEQDEDAGAVLMERILPGDTVGAPGRPVPPPEDWAGLVRDLHGIPADGVQDRLGDRCEEMLERVGARRATPAVRDHVCPGLWELTTDRCRTLLGTDTDEVSIHGDLHLGNALHGGERGLVAIDPKLCVGDRCFDLVDFVVAEGGARDYPGRVELVAGLVGVDPERLLLWSRVNAVVTAVQRLARAAPDARTESLLAFGRGA